MGRLHTDLVELDLTPWYLLPEAAQILRSCAHTPPLIRAYSTIYPRSRDDWEVYAGGRAARLRQIQIDHCSPILNHDRLYKEAARAGALVSVEMAIDAVRTDGGRVTSVLIELPVIDLGEAITQSSKSEGSK